ncbi:BQ2448_4404 [Microbotryum intermedium]|uniref:BQ2448_4404 protein n=1 Tax=Microbotryum intermedium TaxID=269621 RepID=A0A238FHZ4_9BASI|nr:BQ2448_4404 [Microbotryum intermedium]
MPRRRIPKSKQPSQPSLSSSVQGPSNLPHAFRTKEKTLELAQCMVALALQAPDFDPSLHALMGLTCAVRDPSVVERDLKALEKGCKESMREKLGLQEGDQVEVGDAEAKDLQDRLWGPQSRKVEHREMMELEQFPRLIEKIIVPTVQALCEDEGLNFATAGPDHRKDYMLVKGPGNQASSSTATNETLATFVSRNIEDGGEPKYSKEGLRVHSQFLASFEAKSHKGIDMRFLKMLLDGEEGRHLESVVLQAAWSVQEAKNGRFVFFFATPYYMLAELVQVDGKWHLLLDQVFTTVRDDPTEGNSRIAHRPLLALLLALFMDHKESFKIEGSSEEIKAKVREKVKELGAAWDPSQLST